MKTTICDVCYYRDEQLKFSKYNHRFRHRGPNYTTTSIAFHLCAKHKEFFKGCKSLKEAIERARQMGMKIEGAGA